MNKKSNKTMYLMYQLDYLAAYYVTKLVESETHNIDTDKVKSKMSRNMDLWMNLKDRLSNDTQAAVSGTLSKLNKEVKAISAAGKNGQANLYTINSQTANYIADLEQKLIELFEFEFEFDEDISEWDEAEIIHYFEEHDGVYSYSFPEDLQLVLIEEDIQRLAIKDYLSQI